MPGTDLRAPQIERRAEAHFHCDASQHGCDPLSADARHTESPVLTCRMALPVEEVAAVLDTITREVNFAMCLGTRYAMSGTVR